MDTGSPQRDGQGKRLAHFLTPRTLTRMPHFAGLHLREKRLARFLTPRVLIPFVSVMLLAAMVTWFFSPLDFLHNAQAASMSAISGQIPQMVRTSQVTGDTDPNTNVTIAVGLRLRNQSGLEQYVKSISQTTNRVKPTLTTDQLIRAYGPLPSDEQAVIDYMQQFGFKTTETFKMHTMIGFSGTIGQAEQAFHTQVKNYRSSAGRAFYAPASNP
ncbi:MAG TPA: protease pro-enzyme activation domain-containing protein, partial [Ktedonobacteraceae bacterium]